jgi:hypothetical protein
LMADLADRGNGHGAHLGDQPAAQGSEFDGRENLEPQLGRVRPGCSFPLPGREAQPLA